MTPPLPAGIANAKAVDITADGEAVKVSKKRTKTANQPAAATSSAVSKKKSGRRVLRSVAKEVAGYRPDLKVHAVQRVSKCLGFCGLVVVFTALLQRPYMLQCMKASNTFTFHFKDSIF